MTIKEIDYQISKLQLERNILATTERKEFLERAKNNIGRCFKANGFYTKVLDVPQVRQYINYTDFNEHQYPAIFLKQDDEYPFEFDTLFSGSEGLFNKYEEISKEEFNAKFDRVMNEFMRKIKEA